MQTLAARSWSLWPWDFCPEYARWRGPLCCSWWLCSIDAAGQSQNTAGNFQTGPAKTIWLDRVRLMFFNVFHIYIWHFSRQSLKWSDHGWGMFEHASVTCCFPNVAKVVIYMISIVTKSFFGDYHEEFSTVGVWASVIVCVILASGSIAWWIWFANSCQMFAGFLISPSLCNSVRNKSFCISEALLRIFEAGMFTLFRCFTEACETYEGDPIPEKLYLR